MYTLSLAQFQNLRLIITYKYIIILNQNGILKFKTNFYNILILNNILYCNFNNYLTINSNLKLFYINKYYLYQNFEFKNLLYYYTNYINQLYNAIYYATYTYNLSIILKGIGYKFIIENNLLKIRIGYSHYIDYTMDKDVYFRLPNTTTLCLYSNNKEILTKIISFLKLQKKTNLYKGTGIFYIDEVLTLKKKNNNKNAK